MYFQSSLQNSCGGDKSFESSKDFKVVSTRTLIDSAAYLIFRLPLDVFSEVYHTSFYILCKIMDFNIILDNYTLYIIAEKQ